MKLLDTTFLIDFLNKEEGAFKKAKEISNSSLFTTEVNVFEVLVGVYKKKKFEEEKVFLDFLNTLEVLPLRGKATITAAKVFSESEGEGQKIGIADILTAGIALANSVTTIVTRDKEHFSRIKGIKVEGY